VAAMNANIWDQTDAIEALLAARRPVDVAALADSGTDLGELAGTDPAPDMASRPRSSAADDEVRGSG
jgi:hypothetical protein